MAKITLKDIKRLIENSTIINSLEYIDYKTAEPDGSYTIYMVQNNVEVSICTQFKVDDSESRFKSANSHVEISIGQIETNIFDEKLTEGVSKYIAKLHKRQKKNVESFLKGKSSISRGGNVGNSPSNYPVEFKIKE